MKEIKTAIFLKSGKMWQMKEDIKPGILSGMAELGFRHYFRDFTVRIYISNEVSWD